MLNRKRIKEILEEDLSKYSEKSNSLKKLEKRKADISKELDKTNEEIQILNQEKQNKNNIIERINIEVEITQNN